MSDLDPLTKKKAAQKNSQKLDALDYAMLLGRTISAGIGNVAGSVGLNGAYTQMSVTFTQWHTPRVKKGCGQRKNKRDKAGRARHVEMLPYGYAPTITLAA